MRGQRTQKTHCDERAQWSTALHDIPARMKVFIGGASFKLCRKSRANSWRLAEREISLSTFEFSQISMRSIAATNMNLTHDLLLSLCGQPSTKLPVHASGRHEQRRPPLPKARVLLEHREQVRTPCELLDKVNSEKLVAAFLVIDVCLSSDSSLLFGAIMNDIFLLGTKLLTRTSATLPVSERERVCV